MDFLYGDDTEGEREGERVLIPEGNVKKWPKIGYWYVSLQSFKTNDRYVLNLKKAKNNITLLVWLLAGRHLE